MRLCARRSPGRALAQRAPPLGHFFEACERVDGSGGSGYLVRRYRKEAVVSESDEQRIAREESSWNAPKLFALGFIFLGICIAVIYAMASM